MARHWRTSCASVDRLEVAQTLSVNARLYRFTRPETRRESSSRNPRCAAVSLNGARTGDCLMMDIVMLAIAAAFFAVSVAYVYACDRL
jgi:hypothetical protein